MSPSRSSKASWIPVDAPEGTVPRPLLPSLVQTSTSTVGFPLESRTCLAFTSVISESVVFFDIALTVPGIVLVSMFLICGSYDRDENVVDVGSCRTSDYQIVELVEEGIGIVFSKKSIGVHSLLQTSFNGGTISNGTGCISWTINAICPNRRDKYPRYPSNRRSCRQNKFLVSSATSFSPDCHGGFTASDNGGGRGNWKLVFADADTNTGQFLAYYPCFSLKSRRKYQ